MDIATSKGFKTRKAALKKIDMVVKAYPEYHIRYLIAVNTENRFVPCIMSDTLQSINIPEICNRGIMVIG